MNLSTSAPPEIIYKAWQYLNLSVFSKFEKFKMKVKKYIFSKL